MRDEKSKPSIILLHGWGLNGNVYYQLQKLLEKKGYCVFSPDLPGFASEPLQSDKMVLSDYVLFLKKFIEKNNIKSPIIIGHSFGGRVALKFIWQYPQVVKKLVLTGVPVIRHKSLKRRIAFFAAVIGGKIFKQFPQNTQTILRKILYRSIGEWDYYKAGPLKQVFTNIIGEELILYAKTITIPTILVWGIEDHIVPASDMKKIQKLIPQSTTVAVSGIGHKLPYQKPREFFDAIASFI